MAPRVRLGVIGAGSWAVSAHLPALKEMADEVELVGVSRLGPEALQRIKERFGFQVASEDYREVLDAGLDAVIVASPSAMHAEHARAALGAGAHVLCEKPFTITSADAWGIVEAAEEAGRHLLVSFGWNFKPMVEQAAQLLRHDGIGPIEHLSVTMSSQTRELLMGTGAYPEADPETVPAEETWTVPEISGGGYGQAQLSHALALALGLTGERVVGAFALMTVPPGRKVELHDALSLRLAGGGIAAVGGASSYVGADANKHHLVVEAVGGNGQFMVDVFRERVSIFRPGRGETALVLEPGEGAYDGSLAARALVDMVTGRRRANPAPGELGARTVEALELAYASAASGRFEARAPSGAAVGGGAR